MPEPRRRKPVKVQFDELYFKSYRGNFSRAFLSKSLRERSGILAKQFRRTQQAVKDLKAVWRKLADLPYLSNEELNKRYSKEQLIAEKDRAQKIYEQMLTPTIQIFSQKYINNLGFNRDARAETEFERTFHDAVNFRIKIDHLYTRAYKRLG